MGVRGQRYSPAALSPGKRPGTHFIRGWMGPEPAWSDAKNLARIVRLVASRFTDSAIAAQFNMSILKAVPFFPYKPSYILSLDRGKWLASRSGRFASKKASPGTHRIRG